LIASGRIHPGRLVTHTFSLDQVGAAFARLEAGDPGTVKVHIRPQEAAGQ